MSELGRIGYEAYASYTGGKTYDGKPMPTWDELPEKIKGAWTVAAREVRLHTHERSVTVVTFVEGYFEDLVSVESLSRARDYISGISLGASYYGAGSCTGYILPDDECQLMSEADMFEEGEAFKAIEAWRGEKEDGNIK